MQLLSFIWEERGRCYVHRAPPLAVMWSFPSDAGLTAARVMAYAPLQHSASTVTIASICAARPCRSYGLRSGPLGTLVGRGGFCETTQQRETTQQCVELVWLVRAHGLSTCPVRGVVSRPSLHGYRGATANEASACSAWAHRAPSHRGHRQSTCTNI